MSLTNTATFTRKLITGVGIILGAGLISLLIFNIGKGVYKKFYPDKPVPPLIAFGKLPPLKLDEGFAPPSGITYRLETVTGDLPKLPQIAKVFSVESPEIKFGDQSRTNNWAQSLGFNIPPIQTKEDTAIFLSKDGNKTLKLGVIDQIGEIDSDYLNDLKLISSKHNGVEGAKTQAERVVKVFGVDSLSYPNDKLVYTKYKIDNGSLKEVNDLANINLIQVNFYRGNMDKIPVVYPEFGKTKIWVLTSGEDFVAAKINATKIQEYKFSTYTLKGVQKAFEELKAGNARYNQDFKGSTFDIRDVKLAYLDTEKYQPYLQPVYMFEGNDGLSAYVSAVSNLYLKAEIKD